MAEDLEKPDRDLAKTTRTSALKELQQQFLTQVFGPEIPADPARQLYRELSRYSIQETIDLIYSFTKEIYESAPREISWQKLGEDFITRFPPQDFRLNWAAEKFHEELLSDPAIEELANYEWARFQSVSSRNAHSKDWLNPSLLLRYYDYEIPQWYLEIENGNSKHTPQANPTLVAVFRNPETGTLRTLVLQPAAYELLLQWTEGGSPKASAEVISNKLGCSLQEVVFQMLPFLKMLLQEKIMLRSKGIG